MSIEKTEKLKKQIIYRAKSVGYRELSLIFKSFLDSNINKLNYDELILLLDIVNMDDRELYNQVLQIDIIRFDNKILEEFVKFGKNLASN
jgi:succinate dehydrogenase flavin-adding protein (antitoxin of CptAB toxin-antitoxin module)